MAEPIPPELWPQVSAAFDACLDAAADAGADVDGAMAARLQDLPPRVAHHVRALLAAHAADGGLGTLGGPLEAALDEAARPPAAAPGQCLGPYRLMVPLGRGGMAEVWGAEQVEGALQGRRVAIKLPLHGRRLSARLDEERGLLLALEHPHIARLYDAGTQATPQGPQPWLALEWVGGEPIDHALAGLPLRSRLIVFLQVLDAVRHAHGRLILHADLKPANILVDADRQVKLLDFGIARLLDHEGPHAFTPASAAPEQRLGARLSVATDVYGLGQVLARLVPPPDRLSLAGRALERVIERACAEAPEHRYADVDALAQDIHRVLDHRPVRAWPANAWPGRLYHLRCLLRRQRLPLLAVLALLLGLGAALWQGQVARREARRAEAASAYLLDLFKTLDRRAADADQPAAALRRLLDARSAEIERHLPEDPATADELLRITATLHDYLGDAGRSRALGQRRRELLLHQLGPRAPATLAAGLALIWPLLAERDTAAAQALLDELDAELPAHGLQRAEWLLARHDQRRLQGADPAEREALLRAALARYAADAPQDSGHAATWLALSELLEQQARLPAALQAVDEALLRVPQAQPYIASDHARQLLQRAQLRGRLGQPGAAADDEAALGLLRHSVGLRAPFVRAALTALIARRCASDPAAAETLAAEAGLTGCTRVP